MSPKVKYTKDSIVDAAFAIAEVEGLKAITARKVAQHLQGSVAPIYVNFKTMEELQAAVVEKIIEVSDCIMKETKGDDLFQRIGKASLLFAKKYPVLFRDMMWVSPASKETLAQRESYFIAILKLTEPFLTISDASIADLFLKVKIFQLGLSTMVAADQLPSSMDDNKVEALLNEVGTLFYQKAQKRV